MYEIWYVMRDDWGQQHFYKQKGFKKKLQTAIKIAMRLGKNSYVKKYGTVKPIWINNPEFSEYHNATN